jgi:hypothetical protein
LQSSSQQEDTRDALGILKSSTNKLEGVANTILDYLASKASFSNKLEMAESLRTGLVTEIYQEDAGLESNIAHLIPLRPERRRKLQDHILSSLQYETMDERQTRIPKAYESTFEWALHDTTSEDKNEYNLKSWLESDDQVYWITGKAGSGKSTLMKFICQPVLSDPDAEFVPYNCDPNAKQISGRCKPYLNEWAAGKKLFIGSFYFWNSGTRLQRTHAGLFRSLLYEILHLNPELIPVTVLSRWESLSMLDLNPGAWKDAELQLALNLAVRAVTTDAKLCLFIDGLDEFEGDHEVLISLIRDLTHQNNDVKLCVASRPWVVFEDAFETKPHLRLETLTYNDILHYVSSNFHNNTEFQKLAVREPTFADQLIQEVVSKASGVFLWVHLVVSSLLSGMSYGDRILDLQKRLHQLPPDLEDLYDRLLRSLNPFYLEHAAQMLMVIEASRHPLPLILFSFADEETAQSVESLATGPMEDAILLLRLDSVARRLNSRWKGLLEINKVPESCSPDERAHQTIQYLHRTVKDFVKSKKVSKYLKSCLNRPFDPHLSLCIAYCAYIKTFQPPNPTETVNYCLWHAARALPSSEKDVLGVLDIMAVILPSIYVKTTEESVHVAGNSATASFPLTPCHYLNVDWEFDVTFGETFLSLAVIHGVTSYVKARAKVACLVQKPCHGGRSMIWPLLMDAVYAQSYQLNMVRCLLSLGADPNYRVPPPYVGEESPWYSLLRDIEDSISGLIKSYSLSKDLQLTVEAMVMHGASVAGARKVFGDVTFKNRYGTQEVISRSRQFTDEFFTALESLPTVNRTAKKPAKWSKFRKTAR